MPRPLVPMTATTILLVAPAPALARSEAALPNVARPALMTVVRLTNSRRSMEGFISPEIDRRSGRRHVAVLKLALPFLDARTSRAYPVPSNGKHEPGNH